MNRYAFSLALISWGVVAIIVSLSCDGARADGPCTAWTDGDGDSFTVTCGGTQAVVRVLSIDTPEAQQWVDAKGVTRAAECWGVKASKARKALTNLGAVTLTGTDDDGHGRWLRYVTLADGRDLGAALIASGDAALFKGVANGDTDYVRYAPLQLVAQAAPVGMWASCANAPGHNGRTVP